MTCVSVWILVSAVSLSSVLVSGTVNTYVPFCPSTTCIARVIPRPCRRETLLIFNGRLCLGCPRDICNVVPYCPNVMCAQVQISEECRRDTFFIKTYDKQMCRGCPVTICGKANCPIPGGCNGGGRI